MNTRSIGLLGESPGPFRRWLRALTIVSITGALFALGIALMAIATA